MRLSLNEVEVTVRKAGLGAGLPLGLAEDAGRAAAWLGARGWPVAELMAAALEGWHAKLYVERDAAVWRIRTTSGACSVLRAAPSACDLVAAGARSGAPVCVESVLDLPMVAIAMAALASADSGISFAIEIAERPAALLLAGEARLLTASAALAALRNQPVCIRTAMDQELETPPRSGAVRAGMEKSEGAGVPAELWGPIRALADRMLVPATAHSHERGAGAGLIDTD
jgi:uncharacterized protein DUF3726